MELRGIPPQSDYRQGPERMRRSSRDDIAGADPAALCRSLRWPGQPYETDPPLLDQARGMRNALDGRVYLAPDVDAEVI